MCFSTPDYPSPPAQPQIVEVPTPVATPSPATLPADQRVDKRDLVAEDAERRRAAAREGFEGTWLSKDRYRPKTEEEEEGLSLSGTSTKQPKTVLRKTFG